VTLNEWVTSKSVRAVKLNCFNKVLQLLTLYAWYRLMEVDLFVYNSRKVDVVVSPFWEGVEYCDERVRLSVCP